MTEPLEYFEIFETMKLVDGRINFLNEHIARMKSAADYFLFKFSEKKIRKYLEHFVEQINSNKPKKIKLLLDKWGRLIAEISDVNTQQKNTAVILSEQKINSMDRFRYFKTTNRNLYDEEFEKHHSKKFYEVIFLNEKDEVVEGSRTNLFIRIGKTWRTPSLNSGALPGIYRNFFLQNHPDAVEQRIDAADLVKADEVILTNAVQGTWTG